MNTCGRQANRTTVCTAAGLYAPITSVLHVQSTPLKINSIEELIFYRRRLHNLSAQNVVHSAILYTGNVRNKHVYCSL